jgi:hypothetical protein
MIVAWKPLSCRVIVVATANLDVGDWSAYIDAVPGRCHREEYQEVGRSGNKLPRKVAELLFPEEAIRYHWRD